MCRTFEGWWREYYRLMDKSKCGNYNTLHLEAAYIAGRESKAAEILESLARERFAKRPK